MRVAPANRSARRKDRYVGYKSFMMLLLWCVLSANFICLDNAMCYPNIPQEAIKSIAGDENNHRR